MIETAISFWTDIQRYEDMLEADPRSYCFAPLSELYRKLGLLDDAIAVAQKGCGLHPDYPGGFLALANACIDKGRKQEAREALERALELAPDDLNALKQLGRIYLETGDTILAEQVLRRVVAADPADTESELMLRTLGTASRGESPEEEVLEDLEIIEELTDEWGELEAEAEVIPQAQPARNPLSTATMAELYASQGFPEKALLIYRELLTEEPGNVTYRRRVAELEGAPAAPEAPVAGPAGARITPAAAAPAASHGAGVSAAAAAQESVGEGEAIALLEGWLENIRRRRHAL